MFADWNGNGYYNYPEYKKINSVPVEFSRILHIPFFSLYFYVVSHENVDFLTTKSSCILQYC